jgi:hypothetical protein
VKSLNRAALAAWCMALAVSGQPARAQGRDHLTSAEREKLRDAQDPSARIKVYLAFEQERLDRIEQLGERPFNGSASDRLVGQYISITDEMKRWVQYQFDRNGDMRAGLRELVERGPQQLEELRRIERSSAPDAGRYRRSLKDAIADMTDAVDGGAQAFSDQEKKFGKLKRERKLEAQQIKARRKEAEKRNKEEKKLLKHLRKKDRSGETD